MSCQEEKAARCAVNRTVVRKTGTEGPIGGLARAVRGRENRGGGRVDSQERLTTRPNALAIVETAGVLMIRWMWSARRRAVLLPFDE